MAVKIVIYVLTLQCLLWNKKRVQAELLKMPCVNMNQSELVLRLNGVGNSEIFKICLDEFFQFDVQFV